MSDTKSPEDFAAELYAKVGKIISTYKAKDMSTEKILQRIAVVTQLGGATRTGAMGAAAAAAIYGCVTGLTKSQLLGLVGDLFDTIDGAPESAEAKELYAAANAEYKTQQAMTSQPATEHGFSEETTKKLGGMILAPMPKMKQ